MEIYFVFIKFFLFLYLNLFISLSTFVKFKYEYVQKRDYGIEYFEGNVKDMIKTINYILNIKNDIKNTKIIKKKYLDQFLIKHLKQISLYFGIYIRYCKKNTIIKRLKHIAKK